MNRGNKLWEGHRLLLPELRDKTINTCRKCVFLTDVIGREETRTGCLAGVREYGTLEKKVPREIHASSLIRQLGRTELDGIVARGSDPDAMACGLFRAGINKD